MLPTVIHSAYRYTQCFLSNNINFSSFTFIHRKNKLTNAKTANKYSICGKPLHDAGDNKLQKKPIKRLVLPPKYMNK